MKKNECSVTDCQNSGRLKRGYCAMHYQRVMKYGDPNAGNPKYSTWQEALQKRVRQDGECLTWTGSVNQWGYGRVQVGGRKLRVVHHLAWEVEHGPIPDGLEIDHVCFNRGCVNVEHLRTVTKSENARHRQGAQPGSKSGVRNVHAYGRAGRWQVRLKVDGKHISYGVFDTIEEATKVATLARKDLFDRP